MKFAAISLLSAALFFPSVIHAEVNFEKLYTDNMVLQRDVPIVIRGTGTPKETIAVSMTEENVNSTTITVGLDGRWRAVLSPLSAGGPYCVQANGTSTTAKIQNVMTGDVWLCGGQSNMDTDFTFYLKQHPDFITSDTFSTSNDNLRMVRIGQYGTTEPISSPAVFLPWRESSPNVNLKFSATGYFFGENLQKQTGIPIGLIHAAVGGSALRTWVPRSLLSDNAQLQSYLDQDFPTSAPALRVSRHYNGMIAPLHDFPIKGIIWYQGETDAFSGEYYLKNYEELFIGMVKSWRERWQNPDMPFIYVTLAGYFSAESRQDEPVFAMIRNAQIGASNRLKNVAVVSAADAGMEDDIHPPFKKLVGERLTSAALNLAYGDKNAPAAGPEAVSVRHSKIAGEVLVQFRNTGKGLQAKNVDLYKHPLSCNETVGFEMCGSDGVYFPAKADIRSSDTVALKKPREIKGKPVSVRFAWANFPLANVYSAEELPALPFRKTIR